MTIEEIKKLLAAATPGPWVFGALSGDKRKDGSDWGASGCWSDGNMIFGSGDGWDREYSAPNDSDEKLIAAAPEAIAFLLAEVERLHAELNRKCACVRPYICFYDGNEHPLVPTPYCAGCGGRITANDSSMPTDE